MALPLLLSARECLSNSSSDHHHPSARSAAAATAPATAAALRRRLARGLRLSRTRRFRAPPPLANATMNPSQSQHQQQPALLWLDLDAAEARHLLVSTADGGVALYDAARLGGPSGRERACAPLAPTVSAAGAHRAAASGCCWYPVDSGAFVSCGHDGRVVVWDTNALVPAAEFALLARRGGIGGGQGRGLPIAASSSSSPDCVAANAVAMSPVAAQHCLIAAAAGDGTVRLCDAASGAVAHTLGGGGGGGGSSSGSSHGGGGSTNPTTVALAWSRLSEYELAAGDALGRVLVWDVRRAGPRAALDSRDTDVAAAAAAAAQAAAARRGGGRAGGSSIPAFAATAADPWSCRAHGAPVLAVHAAGPGAGGAAGDGLLLTAGCDGRVAAWAPRAPHRRVVAHFSGAGAGAALARHRWDVAFSLPQQQQQPDDPAQQQQQQLPQQQTVGAGAARGLRLASDDAAGLLFAPAGRAVYAYGLGPLPLDDRDDVGGASAAGGASARARNHNPLAAAAAAAAAANRPPPLGEPVAALREGHYGPCVAVCWNAAAGELYSAGLDGALLVWAAEDDEGDDDGAEDGGEEEEEGGAKRRLGRGRDDDWARGRALLHERRREQRRRERRRQPPSSSTPAWLGLGGGGGGGRRRGDEGARARAREARRRRPALADRDDWSTTSLSEGEGDGGSSSDL